MIKKIIFILGGIIITLIAIITLKPLDDTKINIADNLSSEVVQEWIDLILVITKETPGFTPPVASRAFGYTAVSLYESTRFGIPNSESLAGQINDYTENNLINIDTTKSYDWRIVANSNLATTVHALYKNMSTENKIKVDNLEKELLNRYSINLNEETIENSIVLGRSVAEAVIDYSISDGQSEAYNTNFSESHQPPEGDGLWEPTPEKYQTAMQPNWGEVRPFLTANIKPTLPPAPPEYSLEPTSQFYLETKEVYDTVQSLTDEEKVIAEFWSDDPGKTSTPPGHSLSILNQILAKENTPLDEAVVAFTKLSIGVHDAFIACWYSKFTYNYIRPITVIHKNIDPNFSIPLDTPPFPEYPSGHSVQSGASAQILADIFGENYNFTDTTHQHRTDIDGSPRTFNSFTDFANEAAISRLYGGIHFRSAIELGVEQGREIGKNVSTLTLVK